MARADIIDWRVVSCTAPFSVLCELIGEYPDDIKWTGVSFRKDLTDEFIRMYSDKLLWSEICFNTPMEVITTLVDDFSEQVSWPNISTRTLNEEFVRKYHKRLRWFYLSQNKCITNFTDQFFIDFAARIQWEYLFKSIHLSNSFKEKYKHKLIWENLEE